MKLFKLTTTEINGNPEACSAVTFELCESMARVKQKQWSDDDIQTMLECIEIPEHMEFGVKKMVEKENFAELSRFVKELEEMGYELEDLLFAESHRQTFSATQLYEIYEGQEIGLDTSVYAKPEFDCMQMRQIRYGLEAGVDTSIYAKPEFNWKKMEQIRLGLEK
jgi:hypothetical protein